MKKKILLVIILLVLIIGIVVLIPKNKTKTAGRYLDRIVELRQQKQGLLNQIKELDKQIIEYRNKMNELQYSGLDYLGLQQETGMPERTGVAELSGVPIPLE